jgi:hypothetical protein
MIENTVLQPTPATATQLLFYSRIENISVNRTLAATQLSFCSGIEENSAAAT